MILPFYESQVLNSVTDSWHFGTDPDADADPRIRTFDQRILIWILLLILLFSSVTFKKPTKKIISLSFYAYSILKVIYIILHRRKSH